jgi:hypothetical protein
MVGILALLAVGSFAPSGAAAQSLKEPSSGISFEVRREVLGKPSTCVGVGLRKVLVVAKVYAAGLYVADDTGRASFRALLDANGGNVDAVRGTAKLYSWLINGDFGKAMEWVFVRDLEKGKMAKTIRESLEREVGDLNAPDIKDAADQFLAAVDIPLKKWQRLMVVQRPGWEIVAALDGKQLVKVRNKKIAQAIWRIYFGSRPVQADLKKNLLAQIGNLQ